MIDYLILIFKDTWNVLCEMSPYLLLGFLFAGIISVFISTEFVKKHLGKNKFKSVVKASLFGVPLPLCSCSIIPVSASLKKSGASNGATTAFMISTPQTGIDSIFVTYGLLGPVFAIFKPLAAFISGIIGGVFVNMISKDQPVEVVNNNNDNGMSCCLSKKTPNKLINALYYGFITIPRDIGKPLLLGLFIAGIITAILPASFFANYIGSGFFSMFVVLLFSIPFYVCATASVPIAAAFIATGMSPGAALVFLMAGPATNAATISTIWKIMGRGTAIIYLITMAITAILSGILLNSFLNISNSAPHHVEIFSAYSIFENISAALLLIVLFYGIFEDQISRFKNNKQVQHAEIKVEESSCGCHCSKDKS